MLICPFDVHVHEAEAAMPNSRTNSAVQWIKTIRPAGVYISAMVYIQLSLEAVRRQLADINRKCVPKADYTWKEGMTVLCWFCTGSAYYLVSDPLVRMAAG